MRSDKAKHVKRKASGTGARKAAEACTESLVKGNLSQHNWFLFNANPQPMCIFALDTLEFLRVNEAAIRHYGYSNREFLSMTIRDMRPPEEVPRLLEFIPKFKSDRSFRSSGTWTHRKKDGTLIEVECVGHTLALSCERACLVILNDVTERKQLQDQLRHAEKMEAVGRLAGGIAHDFNNLLAGIIGFTELLLDHLSESHPAYAKAKKVLAAAHHGASLTRQLLAFSRKQVVQPKHLNPNPVVSETLEFLRGLIGKDIELISCLDPNVGHIKIDPSQLWQVVLNLAINARDAMPQGGKLTVEVTKVSLWKAIASRHDMVPRGHYVLLAVGDNGVGMDEETQDRIFEPFFTKDAGEGTGLGLSTVFGIVKQAGGFLRVCSLSGAGSRFEIYLPRVEEKEEEG